MKSYNVLRPFLISILFVTAVFGLNVSASKLNQKANRTKAVEVITWPKDETPHAPPGFKVSRWADRLTDPSWIYVAPNGDVFISEVQGAGRITLLRSDKGSEKPKLRQVFLQGLNRPIGMLISNNWFYVANTDGVWRYHYKEGQTKISGKGQKIKSLPEGGLNWMRNLMANAEGSKLYVSVGSSTNLAENGLKKEKRRANILEMNFDGSDERVLATGLRNPVGMGINPQSRELWTVVNERDQVGDNLIPDFLTSIKAGAFYGWPYSYFGVHPDPRIKETRPDLVKTSVEPEVSLGANTGATGMVFYDKKKFSPHYQEGVFISQSGTANRGDLFGYKVSFVPFTKGYASGEQEDFLTGFISDKNKKQVFGQPVGLAVNTDGDLLVADAGARVIWKVSMDQAPADEKK